MKFKGTLIGEASGSVASLVFSHNRGGQYVRARTIPTNPNSTFQQVIRAFVAELTSRWLTVLSDAQRIAWNTYALQVPLNDSLGEPRNIGGLAQFIRTNIPRRQSGKSQIDAAPTTFDLGTFTPLTLTSVGFVTQLITTAFTNTDAWATAVGGHVFIFASRPQNASINYFKGPYRLAGSIDGAVIPPTSPDTAPVPFAVAVGQRVFVMYRVSQVDGRLSLPQRLNAIVG